MNRPPPPAACCFYSPQSPCASPRSFTVVVLMRDESGYMMLLLLLPFHQRRKPTNTRPTHTRHRGIPLWQPASCPHTRPSRARRLRGRLIRGSGGEKRSARSGFSFFFFKSHLLWMRFSSLSSKSGLTRRKGLSPGLQDSRASCCCCCTPGSASSGSARRASTPGGFEGGCLGLFCRARSTQTRRCHGAHISLVLRTQRQRRADPLRPKLPSCSE